MNTMKKLRRKLDIKSRGYSRSQKGAVLYVKHSHGQIENLTRKFGRNDPCPVCNSGVKFKHCCLRKD